MRRTWPDGSVVAGDVDAPGLPSVGMRSYLRVAARHPGRAGALIEQLETLVRLGPTTDVLADLAEVGVVDLDRLRTSDGGSPDELAGRALPHLREFVAGGEPAEEREPETGWEWRARYAALGSLFGGSFYPYWTDDHSSHDAVIDELLAAYEDPAEAVAIVRELRELCARHPDEDEIRHAVGRIGFGGPLPRGVTMNAWLDHVAARFRAYAEG